MFKACSALSQANKARQPIRWVVPKCLCELRVRLLVLAMCSPLSTVHFIVTSKLRTEYLWRSKFFDYTSFFVNSSYVTEVRITFFSIFCAMLIAYLCGTSVIVS